MELDSLRSIRGDLNPSYVLPNHWDDEVHSLSHPDAWNSSAIQGELALLAGEIKGAGPATDIIVPYIWFRFSSTHSANAAAGIEPAG